MTAREPIRFLVTGAGGQLGRELLRHPGAGRAHVFAFDRRDMDITDPELVHRRIEEVRPDVIVNAAAYTLVDRAEEESELAYAVNAQGAGAIAEAAAKVKARIIHISTDYVFNGTQGRFYETGDTPAPVNVYGQSKWEGEKRVIRAAPDSAVIIRTSWLYSVYGTNFVKTMLRLMAERDEIAVVSDQIGTPTWARGLADLIWNTVEDSGLHGTFHWRDEGVASWYDLAVAVKEEARAAGLLDCNPAIRPISTAEYPTAAMRPCSSVLRKNRCFGDYVPVEQHWRASLREMLRDYRAHQERS